MPSALEALRASKMFEVTLPSGLQVTIRLPRLRDVVAAGDIPMSILTKLSPEDGQPVTELTPEEMAYVFRFNDEIVRMAIVAMAGEDVSLVLDDVKLLDEADCSEIVALALREKSPLQAG